MAWSIISVFVVPAMVIDNVGPIDAIKKSLHAIRKTWGESLVRYYGLGLAQTAATILGAIVLLVPALIALLVLNFFVVAIVFGALFVIYLVIISLVFSTANTVFNTALFLYATKGKIPLTYSKETMHHAFAKK